MSSGRAPATRLRPHRSYATRIPSLFSRALLGAILCGAALPAASHAEPSKEELQVARTLFGQALEEEKLEHWELALGKLESVQAIKASPSVRYHIALCEEKLGRLASALSDYEAARVAARNEGNREVLAIVDEPIARLTGEVPHLTLTLAAPPPNTKVEIDGRNLTVIGFNVPIPLDPGRHAVIVSAPDRVTFKHSLALQPRADVGVQVVLKPYTVGATGSPDPVAPPPAERKYVHPARPYAIATTAGAIVLVGTGVGLFFASAAVKNGHQEGNGCSAAGETTCSGGITAVRVLDWSAGGAWLGAVGLAAASIVLWTRPGQQVAAHAPSHTRLAVGPGRIGLEGTFE